MKSIQNAIISELNVQPPFNGPEDIQAEIQRRLDFIKDCLRDSGMKTLVLGISGGVDSLTAGMLCQRAVEQLRAESGNDAYRFIAVRLPYNVQGDEADAQASVDVIAPDERHTVNIGPAVKALAAETAALEGLPAGTVDFALGNTKARIRMVAQYTIANARQGLVVGTDHAAEAVMGFFTKFGDGACDLAPLTGLVKNQVRTIARTLGAPENLVMKTPTADLEDLAPGKPDEHAHGVTYRDIDAYLHGGAVDPEAAEIIERTFEKTRHKREMPKTP
ncbi:NH(3)-dependent NAD(+) synthetase [compost metagenome]|uniref:NH(3)-dependent NAD(+) synthetase n=1 Tax=Pseudomonas jinjuensis TaxID=198616 RepID=A0A1H0N662_9PSED|nr:ammonia-dependent NAD(+) synthetase [Pseudomonas jinjuensis]SDO88219.1 NAD+ synthase [Pseudomonas jinjuensis]